EGDFDTTETETFTAEITEAIEADVVRVLLDFEGIGFVNSTALGALLRAQKHLAQYGGGMAASGPNPAVRRVFEVLQLDRRIPLFPDRGPAITHLESMNPESVSTGGEEVEFFRPDAADTFGSKARRGRLEEMHEDGLTLTFDNLEGLDPEATFPQGAPVQLRFRLPLYHPSHVFKPEAEVAGIEVLGRETISLRVTFTTLAEHEREAVEQYVKDLRYLKDEA
ncbi:MAG: STAS domain-containing protein, partial [Planctomycetota bacterium]